MSDTATGAGTATATYTTDELMIVNAARELGRVAASGHPIVFTGTSVSVLISS